MSTEVNQGLELSITPQTVSAINADAKNGVGITAPGQLTIRNMSFGLKTSISNCLVQIELFGLHIVEKGCQIALHRPNYDQGIQSEHFEKKLIPSLRNLKIRGDYYFQQKWDPLTFAKMVTRWLQDKKVKILPWAVQSPDLSPNEQLMSELDRKISNRNFSS
ncbi:Transposable element Tc1 transposase [Folsomia candida]|uniref:Transposable element Tc1 transposase n=1 Tax=Folsomia candida TaxID=158441 RepID=A0A226DIC8_FOLCA|nr:Transposable element Tc1 transposase [Folsomia candida]